ncbi:hypothetical protein ACQKWADRAFT_279163 [Trichoderma austrokoningii]
MGLQYNPDTDVPDLSGKVVFLTGGTSGIGRAAVLELAKHNPAHIYFTGRNEESAQEVISQCANSPNMTFLPCELDNLASIREAAAKFQHDHLDIFIANAGIPGISPALTKDGYEVQFGINHIGNAALLLLLLPIMLRTANEVPGADVRFVATTSLAYAMASGIDFDALRSKQDNMLLMGRWRRYAQSKLANVLFARELGKRYPQITSLAVHPGMVSTEGTASFGIFDKMFLFIAAPRGMLTPREGACNTLWAATSPEVKDKINGETALFEPVGKPHVGNAQCHSEELSKRLWEWTIEEVGVEAR